MPANSVECSISSANIAGGGTDELHLVSLAGCPLDASTRWAHTSKVGGSTRYVGLGACIIDARRAIGWLPAEASLVVAESARPSAGAWRELVALAGPAGATVSLFRCQFEVSSVTYTGNGSGRVVGIARTRLAPASGCSKRRQTHNRTDGWFGLRDAWVYLDFPRSTNKSQAPWFRRPGSDSWRNISTRRRHSHCGIGAKRERGRPLWSKGAQLLVRFADWVRRRKPVGAVPVPRGKGFVTGTGNARCACNGIPVRRSRRAVRFGHRDRCGVTYPHPYQR